MWVAEARITPNRIAMQFGVDDLSFSTTYWYDDVDFDALEAAQGADAVRSIVFHVVAFEAAKLTALQPAVVDFGVYRDLVTPAFWELWSTVWRSVWGQWRFEKGLSDYPGPRLAHDLAAPSEIAVESPALCARPLLFVGGGKDSLVAMSVLDAAGYEYDTYSYSHSAYGTAAFQHELIERLASHGVRANVHRKQWVFDDFLDSPVTRVRPDLGSNGLLAAETPSSLFGVLPVVLQHGHDTVVFAHERSADAGNLTWDLSGEEINHQWGKSIEAERLLQAYVETELIRGLTYTSVLKPVYDPVIFSALRRRGNAVRDTHSCSARKPWCEACAKCAYVWINYRGFLSEAALEGMFRTNPADTPANQLWFRQMLGLEDHIPFDCVGQVAETLLAFELASRRGLAGEAVTTYRERCAPLSDATLVELFAVASGHHTMRQDMAARVLPVLESWASDGLALARRALAGR